MGSEESVRDMAITQVSFGGLDGYVTAKDFTIYLEDNIGPVWRCRLKTSWTPPDSYPDFTVKITSGIPITKDYEQVKLHAFVHFGSPESTRYAVEAGDRCDLIFRGKTLKVSLGLETPFHIDQKRRTTTPYKLSGVRVEIGLLVSGEFFVGWRGPPTGVDFLIDPFDGTCKFLFTRDTAFSFKGTNHYTVIKCNYKVEFSVRDINEFTEYKDSSSLVLFLQLISSPSVFYRTADDDIEESVPFEMLDDDDPWIRTTDFTPGGAIGRCNYYRLSIPPRHGMKLKRGVNYFRECRIPKSLRQPLQIRDEPDFGIHMRDSFFCIQYESKINFDILFLLNAVLHKGIINQHQLSGGFYDLLRSKPDDVNVAALRHIFSYKRPVFDACKRLKLVQEWLLTNPKLFKSHKQLDDIIQVRRLVITPTKAYCLPPEVELSNRVLRNYREVADRFLRVTLMDEGMRTINNNVLNYYVAPILKVKDIKSSVFSQKTKVFQRVRSILTEGFDLCGRNYSFLAFSSNQLRDRSAWFFADNSEVCVTGIKTWMGKFPERNVAKCAARMGQCFSSTYATVEVPQNQVDQKLPDIERNNYTFSDGIGIITEDLAMEVANRLNLKDNPPCAYQIRYAGCKGVVACWPSRDDRFRMYLRPSMNKFVSNHSILEICSWARFQPGFLNRQIVTLLSALRVPDEIFWNMQKCMISKLEKMLENCDVAFDILTGSCAEQGHTAAIMLSAGFKPQTEPHLRGMLSCVRAAQFLDLREKARIFVPSGRWLMGCLDELGVLEQGQCFIQVSNTAIENCFSKHGSMFSGMKGKREIVQGLVVIAKNPCLHPGDVRILEAVDAPGLHHLHDCLVFPQVGDRPHTNEASGSDLDGDLYFVTWDENLVPPSKRSWIPMEYTPPETKKSLRPVTQNDIIEFFSRNMVNESLGAICNAHVVHADLSDYGALDEKCIKLAELAALAVDFPKTGIVVSMPANLKPKQYPDYMGKEEFQSYRSQKILGRLYRQVKEIYNEDVAESSEATFVPANIHYDMDLEIPGSADFMIDAWDHKCSYDGQLNGLLGQYKVNQEEEVVTGHIWSMAKNKSRKQGELKERLKHSYSSLRREFRQIFEKLDMDFEHLSDYERNKKLEQKASAWYQVTYNPIWLKKTLKIQKPDGDDEHVMLSFPWIASDYLARIKIKCRGMDMKEAGSSKPIDSLAQYIFSRIRSEQ